MFTNLPSLFLAQKASRCEPAMSSPGPALGHMDGLSSSMSLLAASSCSQFHRLMLPLTKPSVCTTDW